MNRTRSAFPSPHASSRSRRAALVRATLAGLGAVVLAAVASAPTGCGADSGSGGASGGGTPAGGGGSGGNALGGNSGSGGSALACPADLPDDPRYCQLHCPTQFDEGCPEDPACPTKAANTCTGRCNDGATPHAVCENGDWTCDVDGQVVAHCTTPHGCLDESCCFPKGCQGPDDQLYIAVDDDDSCHGFGQCGGKRVDNHCDPDGNCTCTLGGVTLGTCKQSDLSNYGCEADVGCCSVWFQGC